MAIRSSLASLFGRTFGKGAASIDRPAARAGFMRDGLSPFFSGWNPPVRESRDSVRTSYMAATARMTDLVQNSGYISGGIEQSVAYTIGTGLRLNAQPDTEALGWTKEEGQAFARSVERRFELWADNPYECDAEGKRTLAQMSAVAFKGWLGTGEMLATLPWKARPGGTYRTKVKLLPSTRLSQRTAYPGLFQGVQMDPDGMPLAYLINTVTYEHNVIEQLVAARDRYGRPRTVHVFDGLPGQVRGITPMASAIGVARKYDQLAEATLTASLLQAIFAASITSDAPSAEVLEGLKAVDEQGKMIDGGLESLIAAKSDYYGETKIDLGRFGKVAHLFTGDKMEFHSSKHPNDTYEAFSASLLRECARCLGLTYMDFTGDYRSATYSSVRMATAAMWLIILYRRRFIVSPFLQPAYEAWLEEEIDSGRIAFPDGLAGFIANRSAVTRASWKGGGKPQADDLKTAKAQQTWKSMGVMSDEAIANELGVDLEDLYEQLARERDMREQYGLPDTAAISPVTGAQAGDAGLTADNSANAAEDGP